MRFRLCFALLFWMSACASAPPSPLSSRPSAFASAPDSHQRIQFVSARTDSQQLPIGKADLEQARALLYQARNDLEPRRWEALAGKLTSAERAFERFSQATKASGQAVEVIRGTEELLQAGRTSAWVGVPPRVGPLLVFLVLLYPSSTAGPEVDRRPEWLDAQGEYEARLRELAEESRRIVEELMPQEELVPQDVEVVVPDFDSDTVAAVTAPTHWRTRINPETGKNYSSEDEYERVLLYPGQTCKNSLLDKLEAEKDQLLREIPRYNPKERNTKSEKKLDKVPCSKIRLRLEAMNKVLEKRREIQKECFGGKPDSGHNTAMIELEKGLAAAKALEAKNCAPGHPLSEL